MLIISYMSIKEINQKCSSEGGLMIEKFLGVKYWMFGLRLGSNNFALKIPLKIFKNGLLLYQKKFKGFYARSKLRMHSQYFNKGDIKQFPH